jgi:hypothetical protein
MTSYIMHAQTYSWTYSLSSSLALFLLNLFTGHLPPLEGELQKQKFLSEGKGFKSYYFLMLYS